ncbi:hypothetical protein [Paenibacillus naphthalenovorans]|uniref:Uncharacterized protein n=1 Tax=Paenibacillus naphthalenovorans TaxID=162209 RepID=A0A0U2M449_9BACL|nr:hypothetical protein [Paenibacillus naphthalenovorans]ALS22304.1 hypothetical protein IJ22_19300 [Paenibacillus naphthalenovorans]
MSIDLLNGKIRVYNYELSPVGFPSQHSQQGVFLRGRDEEEEFVVERVAFDDIEAENSKSDLFKVGRIRFHPDEEDEVYQKLGIEDRENIMTDKQLAEFLMTDTIENVKRISNLRSVTLISRMKSMLFILERAGKIPPHRISASVIERGNELISGGKRNPDSEINKILEAEKKVNEENKLQNTLNELMEKVATLEKEKEAEIKAKNEVIIQSQAAIEKLLKKVEELTQNNQVSYDTQSKKQAGRPPKNG